MDTAPEGAAELAFELGAPAPKTWAAGKEPWGLQVSARKCGSQELAELWVMRDCGQSRAPQARAHLYSGAPGRYPHPTGLAPHCMRSAPAACLVWQPPRLIACKCPPSHILHAHVAMHNISLVTCRRSRCRPHINQPAIFPVTGMRTVRYS
jgi:hypothetical protein